jgi:cytochrome c oxidase accessory protein FixG
MSIKKDMEYIYEDHETYRDSIATVSKDGGRIWMYPKQPVGKYYNRRKLASYIYLVVLFGLPFIKINGNPILQFNILERKFSILGILFFPQDFHIFLFMMLTFVVGVALFTVVYGRLFCGWACPQTVFLEMIYRRIEYAIEGDGDQQRKLNSAKWSISKLSKKGVKHFIFLLIAVLIANTFLSYIIGYEAVWKIASDPINMHITGFVAMILFSLLFYGVFAFLREQVCTTICPYGRLQGVLLDSDSIVISYDHQRGEPRGKLKKSEDKNTLEIKGDCIDCNLCVKVCPTGIDIRNGTQLECVNCTACIDACDAVMLKTNKEPGLIRYDSHAAISSGRPHVITNKVKAYTAVLLLLTVVNGLLLFTRDEIEANILHTPGTTYQNTGINEISNVYNYTFINKSNEDIILTLSVIGGKVAIIGKEQKITLQKAQSVGGTCIVTLPSNSISQRKSKIEVKIKYAGKVKNINTIFLGPFK